MDIALNITTNTNEKIPPPPPLKKSLPFQKKKKGNQSNNDFTFAFTNNAKVKAIVARRRKPINSTALTKSSQSFLQASAVPPTPLANANSKLLLSTKKTYSTIQSTNKLNGSTIVKDKNESIVKVVVPTETTESDETPMQISLNVMSGDEFDYLKASQKTEKQKLSKSQRKELNLQKRADEYKLERQRKLDEKLQIAQTVAAKRQEEQKQQLELQAQPIDNVKSIELTNNNNKQYDSNKQFTVPINKKQTFNDKQFKRSIQENEVQTIVGQRLVKPIYEQVFTGQPMNSIELHPHSVKNIADLLAITELTTVQQRTIPLVLQGRDILVRSQTGSGKTLAYALPIVEKLQAMRPKLTRNSGIQALVIVSTRELAIQCYELFTKLLKPFTWIVSTYITGGEKRKSEKARLRKGINILIGTPGRLCDHLLHTESFKLDKVQWLVLDEADRLYELGYEIDVKRIVDTLNNNIGLQSLLLSATLTSAVKQLAGLTLKNPLFIDTSDTNDKHTLKLNSKPITKTVTTTNNNNDDDDDEQTNSDNQQTINQESDQLNNIDDEKYIIPSTITQQYLVIPPKLRLVTLSGLIASESKKENKKILIFFGTEHLVNYHYDLLVEGLTKHVLDDEDDDDDNDNNHNKFRNNKKKMFKRTIRHDDDDDDEEDYDDEDDDMEYEDYINTEQNEDTLSFTVNIRFFKLHGSLTQHERVSSFKAFREAKSGVFLTTDVACRGIDVPMVDLVVQFSPPQNISDYVHRVGRTARAGRSGQAVLFLSPNEIQFVRMLEEKQIRISQIDSKLYLNAIVDQNNNQLRVGGKNNEETIAKLQHKFEQLVNDDKELHDKACKAFVSWLRFVAAYPKDFRNIFNVKNTHMGHYAKSLALREPPKSFINKHSGPKAPVPMNRLTYGTSTDEKLNKDRKNDGKAGKGGNKLGNGKKRQHQQDDKHLNFNKYLAKSISLTTSEFGSGLPPLKKKK